MRRTLLTQRDFSPVLEPQGEEHYVIAERQVPPNTVEEYRPKTRFFARVGATFSRQVNAPNTVVNLPGYAVRVPELPAGGIVLSQGDTRYPVFVGTPPSPPNTPYGVVNFSPDGVALDLIVRGPANAFPGTYTFRYFPAQGLLKLRAKRKETGVFRDLLQVDLFRLNVIDHDDREKVILLQKAGAVAQDRFLQVVVQGLVDGLKAVDPAASLEVFTLETETLTWDLRQYAAQLSQELRRPIPPDQAAALADASLARV